MNILDTVNKASQLVSNIPTTNNANSTSNTDEIVNKIIPSKIIENKPK
jgi:hypothetical protein